MIGMNRVLRSGESVARRFSLLVLILGWASAPLAESVTLKNGKTYEVETVRGQPVRFANDQIKVRAIGIGILEPPASRNTDSLDFIWILVAELAEKRRYAVTVTTPLDPAATATVEVDGPGQVTPDFFPRPGFPLVWEEIERTGVRWFPFQFAFEDKESKKRFEFTQWARIDDRMWNAVRAQRDREEAKRGIPRKPASEVPERWNFAFDSRQWQLGHQAPTQQGMIREYVPAGQSVRGWSELVTSQYLAGTLSPQQFSELFRSHVSRDCPSLRASTIEEGSDTVIFEWQHAGCQGHPAQHEIRRVSKGPAGLYMLSFTEKTQQLPDDKRAAWVSIIKAAQIR